MNENPYKAPLLFLGILLVIIALASFAGVLSEWNTGAREAYIRHAFWWGTAIFGVLGIGAIAAARRL
jgi:hypothetical protein